MYRGGFGRQGCAVWKLLSANRCHSPRSSHYKSPLLLLSSVDGLSWNTDPRTIDGTAALLLGAPPFPHCARFCWFDVELFDALASGMAALNVESHGSSTVRPMDWANAARIAGAERGTQTLGCQRN